MIRLGCCSFVLGKPLEESLRLISDLGFRYVDVSASRIGSEAQIDQEQAIAHPDQAAATTRGLLTRYQLQPEELFNTRIYVDGRRVEINDPDKELRTRVLLRFQRLCAYAVQSGFKSIMGVPGSVQAALGPDGSWETSAEMLKAMLAIARGQGIRFNIEPHTGSILEMPQAALEMASTVPGLTYTLDYSHFVSLGMAESAVTPLNALAAHMHARQARHGHVYATLAEGTIDFAYIIRTLKAADWDGVIAMEYSVEEPVGLRNSSVMQNVLLACQLEEFIEQE
jgi:sugar phosphate isomerase/epimerase